MAEQPEPVGNIVASQLMLARVPVIGGDRTLRDAMRALVDACADKTVPNALVVVDGDGRYLGMLTAKLLFKSLFALWMPSDSVREDDARLERHLMEIVRDRGQLHVRDTLIRGLPVAAPGDRLLRLIELSCEARLEFVPVVDDGDLLGLIPVTAIFDATASLALNPEHEGIQMDGQAGAGE